MEGSWEVFGPRGDEGQKCQGVELKSGTMIILSLLRAVPIPVGL